MPQARQGNGFCQRDPTVHHLTMSEPSPFHPAHLETIWGLRRMAVTFASSLNSAEPLSCSEHS